MVILLIVIGILILIPLSYIHWFLIIELPKKLGYLKFVLVLICYIFFCGIMVYLLSTGYPNLILFFISLIIVDLLGVYYLRKEFMDTVKKDFKIKTKNKGKDSI
jgi:hypothetical protein